MSALVPVMTIGLYGADGQELRSPSYAHATPRGEASHGVQVLDFPTAKEDWPDAYGVIYFADGVEVDRKPFHGVRGVPMGARLDVRVTTADALRALRNHPIFSLLGGADGAK